MNSKTLNYIMDLAKENELDTDLVIDLIKQLEMENVIEIKEI